MPPQQFIHNIITGLVLIINRRFTVQHVLYIVDCSANIDFKKCVTLHHYGVIVFFQANIGQDEDFKAAREKAESLGAKKVKMNNKVLFYQETVKRAE